MKLPYENLSVDPCIYIIEPYKDFIKIGLSIQPKSRIRKLSLSSGMIPIHTFISKPHSCAREIERYLHMLFFDYRKRENGQPVGEYFNATFSTAVDAAKELCASKNLRKTFSMLVVEHNGRTKQCGFADSVEDL